MNATRMVGWLHGYKTTGGGHHEYHPNEAAAGIIHTPFRGRRWHFLPTRTAKAAGGYRQTAQADARPGALHPGPRSIGSALCERKGRDRITRLVRAHSNERGQEYVDGSKQKGQRLSTAA